RSWTSGRSLAVRAACSSPPTTRCMSGMCRSLAAESRSGVREPASSARRSWTPSPRASPSTRMVASTPARRPPAPRSGNSLAPADVAWTYASRMTSAQRHGVLLAPALAVAAVALLAQDTPEVLATCIANGTKVRHTYLQHADPARLQEAVRLFEARAPGA